MGFHYLILASITEKPEERAELYKKSADEYKEGKLVNQYHQAMGYYYSWLAFIETNPKEQAELYTKSADEFKEGKLDEQYHQAMGWHYNSLANATENPEEQANLYNKSAEELKEGKLDEQYHQVMAWHYYSKEEKLEAAKETNWLYVAGIALKKVGVSIQAKKIKYLTDAISSYKSYLNANNKKFPKFSVFIDSNIKNQGKISEISREISKNLKWKFPPDMGKILFNPYRLNEGIEESDFVFLFVEDDIDKKLAFELGLAYNVSKPIVILAQTNKLNSVFREVATITNNEEYAIAALNVRSIFESQKFIEIGKKDRKDFDSFIKMLNEVADNLGIRLSTKEEKKGIGD